MICFYGSIELGATHGPRIPQGFGAHWPDEHSPCLPGCQHQVHRLGCYHPHHVQAVQGEYAESSQPCTLLTWIKETCTSQVLSRFDSAPGVKSPQSYAPTTLATFRPSTLPLTLLPPALIPLLPLHLRVSPHTSPRPGSIIFNKSLATPLYTSPPTVGGALCNNPFAPELLCHRCIAATGVVALIFS